MAEKQIIPDAFWDNIQAEPNSGCWLWDGPRAGHGYAAIQINKKQHLAHRFSYEALVGIIPDGLELDHLCRVRCCVNPDHLEPVTHKENVRRGTAGQIEGRRRLAMTHCINGHPFSGDNLYITPKGKRGCRTCLNEASRRHYWRNRIG